MKENLLIKFSQLRTWISVIFLINLLMLPEYTVAGIEYFSISENAVVMYDAPSTKAEKLYVVSLHLPVEAVVRVEGWVKVRDNNGSLAWVENKALSSKRYVIVTVSLADVYQAADASSALVFQAQENVVLEWVDTSIMGWAKVRHRDGQTGYIKVNQVWGL
tara:strand:- start:1487 stop:1969 length:483 start_codon:yes stop_codon:yes gene_type:complete